MAEVTAPGRRAGAMHDGSEAEEAPWRRGGAVVLRLWLATVAARAGTDILGAVAWHQPFRIRALYLGFGSRSACSTP